MEDHERVVKSMCLQMCTKLLVSGQSLECSTLPFKVYEAVIA